MRLYRPVGQAELDLIIAADYRSYPPRLPEQPIFYPVLNEKYAREIAEKWNKKSADSSFTAYGAYCFVKGATYDFVSLPPGFWHDL